VLDSDRNLVVANSFGGIAQSSIAAGGVIILASPSDGLDLYPADTTGDAATPVATIGPTMLSIQYPGGMFVDASVLPPVLYVNDYSGNAIFVVQTTGSGASLGVGSVRKIQGPTTTLANPLGIVVVR